MFGPEVEHERTELGDQVCPLPVDDHQTILREQLGGTIDPGTGAARQVEERMPGSRHAREDDQLLAQAALAGDPCPGRLVEPAPPAVPGECERLVLLLLGRLCQPDMITGRDSREGDRAILKDHNRGGAMGKWTRSRRGVGPRRVARRCSTRGARSRGRLPGRRTGRCHQQRCHQQRWQECGYREARDHGAIMSG